MTEEDDEGVEPIPTDSLLGGGGPPPKKDDEGIVIIETDWEQRGGSGSGDDKRG